MLGVALNYPLPYWKVMPGQPVQTDLHAAHPGYRPCHRRLEFGRSRPSDDAPTPEPDMAELHLQLAPVPTGD